MCVTFVVSLAEGFQMAQRFSSREEAKQQAIERQRQLGVTAYRPKGYRYKNFDAAFSVMNRPKWMWTYKAPDVTQGTMVVMHTPRDSPKEYSVLGKYKDVWYIDFPEPPHLLYQRYEWINAETVYVCEGERTADAVEALGLAATTSLGGPTYEKDSDWTPLKGKQVVILADYDDKGWSYARGVAQLCLGSGALSARIIKLPGLNLGEGPREWMESVRTASGEEAILPELQKLVEAAPLEVYVPPVPEPPKGLQLEYQTMADITPATQQWVFDKVVPQGKLTVLMGEPGVGKSLTALGIAAKVTRGLTGPADTEPQEPGSVILFSPQDGVAETTRPRLEAFQADLSKVILIPGFSEQDNETGQRLSWEFQLDRDMSFLETRLKSLQEAGANVRMVVIDPIERFLESVTKKKKEVIESLSARLAKLAMETNVAIVVVTNLPRGMKGTSALNRGFRHAGDLGPFGAVARSVWMVGQDLDNRNRRLLLPVKTNLCALPNSLAYQIENGVIQWEQPGPVLTGDEFLASQETEAREKPPGYVKPTSKLGIAVKWLKKQLSEQPRHGATLIADGMENNIMQKTLRRAYDVLGCRSVNDTFQGKWYWFVPGLIPPDTEDEELETENPAEGEVTSEENA